jgi:hypothetical protein
VPGRGIGANSSTSVTGHVPIAGSGNTPDTSTSTSAEGGPNATSSPSSPSQPAAGAWPGTLNVASFTGAAAYIS